MGVNFCSCVAYARFRWSAVKCTTEQHYNDVMIRAMASQITSLTIVYSSVYSGADGRKRQS